jgi:acyl-CoA thioester hydrolase
MDKIVNSLKLKIAYADTDPNGNGYYVNYLTFFERGRTELLRARVLKSNLIMSRANT